jgi:hypothetical protein
MSLVLAASDREDRSPIAASLPSPWSTQRSALRSLPLPPRCHHPLVNNRFSFAEPVVDQNLLPGANP